MKKKIKIWFPPLLLAALLSGCQRENSKPLEKPQAPDADSVNLTVWGAQEDEELLGEISWEQTETVLLIRADGQDFTLAVAGEDGQEQILANKVDGSFLGSETAGGFVGAYVGMFASGNGTAYEEYVSFDWFSYCSRD